MRMTINLHAPGMTSLHKAGLAGLFMTLRAFDETNEQIKGLSWELDRTEVTLDWHEEKPRAAFEELIDKAFWIDAGFIRLKGLEISQPPNLDQKYQLYTALLNSFLQFGRHRNLGTRRDLLIEVDERRQLIKDFAPVERFRHQSASSDFINKKGDFNKTIVAAGWLYPGAGQRHVAYTDTKLNETPELALALLFAPVGVIYYTIKSRLRGRKARLAMLIPEIPDLSLYAELRQSFAQKGVFELTASSASDAALRMLTQIAANKTANSLAGSVDKPFICRVVTFGIVSWNEEQKSRTRSHTIVSGQLRDFDNYLRADAIFKNRWRRTEPERSFVTTFSAREFIADNVATGKAWYHDITSYISGKDTREQLFYERKELNEMVRTASFDEESERLFIDVCHESWRRHLGKRAASKGTSFSAGKEAERLRSSLVRCKNAESLRETVIDFWSRAGTNRSLRGASLTNLLRLFDENNWKKARDLALLSLISYQPRNEEAALIDEGDEDE